MTDNKIPGTNRGNGKFQKTSVVNIQLTEVVNIERSISIENAL